MSSNRGRPQEITTADIFQALSRADAPFVTTADVAEEIDCSREGARKRLDELVKSGELESRTVGSRAKVWYRSHDPERSVVAFPSSEDFVLLAPDDETLAIARSVARESNSHDGAYWFETGQRSFARTEYESEDRLRRDLELVLPGYDSYVDRLVARWRSDRGLIIRERTGEIIGEAPDSAFRASIESVLIDEWIQGRKGDNVLVFADENMLLVRLALDREGFKYSDFRNTQTELERAYDETAQPALRGELEGVPPAGTRLLGIDSQLRFHVFSVDYPAKEIFVLSDRNVVHQQRLEQGDVSQWIEYVDDHTDGWLYADP